VLGYYQYHAVPGNSTQLRIFQRRVCWLWRSVLVRRSQRAQVRWARRSPVFNRWISQPRILHPYLTPPSPPLILRKSRMRKRACTDLCGGRSVMVVPTATVSVCSGSKIVRQAGQWFHSRAGSGRKLRNRGPIRGL
jgi:hypothetical protein